MKRNITPKEKIEMFDRISKGEDIEYSVPDKYGLSTRNGRNLPKVKLNEYILRLMKQHGVSQTDLSNMLKKSQPTISAFLSGKTPCPTEDIEVMLWLFEDNSCYINDKKFVLSDFKQKIRKLIWDSDVAVVYRDTPDEESFSWGFTVKSLDGIPDDCIAQELKEVPETIRINLPSEMLSSIDTSYHIVDKEGNVTDIAFLHDVDGFSNFNTKE